MKKTLTVLMMVLLAAMLIISCDNSTSEPKTETPTTIPAPLKKTYTVKFDLNGGTGDIKEQQVNKGDKASKPEKNPANLKGAFKFWSLDGTTEYEFDTAITADTTIKAVWTTTFEIGDIGPAGGTVFYVNPNYEEGSTDVAKNWHYLEAAPADLAAKYSWGPTGSSYSTGTGIGTGKSNTDKLIAVSGDFPAAKACADYSEGGYDDWFLPSKDELNLMYVNLYSKGLGSFGSLNYYWSSSEFTVNLAAYVQNFNGGSQYGGSRSDSYSVRPIRAF